MGLTPCSWLPIAPGSFGENTFPEPEVKTFLELCWEALEDPTMIILCVSAAVSLLIGVVKGWPMKRRTEPTFLPVFAPVRIGCSGERNKS